MESNGTQTRSVANLGQYSGQEKSYCCEAQSPSQRKIMEEQPRKIYRCPKDCSVSDYKTRCKRCGQWMLYAGEKTPEEIRRYDEELTRSAY